MRAHELDGKRSVRCNLDRACRRMMMMTMICGVCHCPNSTATSMRIHSPDRRRGTRRTTGAGTRGHPSRAPGLVGREPLSASKSPLPSRTARQMQMRRRYMRVPSFPLGRLVYFLTVVVCQALASMSRMSVLRGEEPRRTGTLVEALHAHRDEARWFGSTEIVRLRAEELGPVRPLEARVPTTVRPPRWPALRLSCRSVVPAPAAQLHGRRVSGLGGKALLQAARAHRASTASSTRSTVTRKESNPQVLT